MTPSEVGERAEAAVVAALIHGGKSVYLPFGASGRCDLVFEDSDGMHRMQVKNGILRFGGRSSFGWIGRLDVAVESDQECT